MSYHVVGDCCDLRCGRKDSHVVKGSITLKVCMAKTLSVLSRALTCLRCGPLVRSLVGHELELEVMTSVTICAAPVAGGA